jgi:hypothetical protein
MASRLSTRQENLKKPFTRRDHQPDLAGNHLALPARMVYLPSRHLLWHPIAEYQAYGRISLASCICTDIGCWPLSPGTGL